MTRYKAIISYDGTLFSGFQRQSQARTVQEEIEKTLQKLTGGQGIQIHGAGRTDAGVHAYGQVIHFDLDQKETLKSFALLLIHRHQMILM